MTDKNGGMILPGLMDDINDTNYGLIREENLEEDQSNVVAAQDLLKELDRMGGSNYDDEVEEEIKAQHTIDEFPDFQADTVMEKESIEEDIQQSISPILSRKSP